MRDLIHPNASYMQWLNDAAGAAQSVTEGLDWSTTSIVVALLTALGVASKFGHLLGPAGSIVGQSVQNLVGVFLPKHKKEADQRAQIMERTAWDIVSIIEALPPDNETVKMLKKDISRVTPPEFNALFDEWKKRRENRGV